MCPLPRSSWPDKRFNCVKLLMFNCFWLIKWAISMIQLSMTVAWPFEYSWLASVRRQHPEGMGIYLIRWGVLFQSRTTHGTFAPTARIQGSENQEVHVRAAPVTSAPSNPMEWFLLHGPAALGSTCFIVLISEGGTRTWDCHVATLGSSWHWANRWRRSLLSWLEWWIPITNNICIVLLKSVGFLSFTTKVYHRSSLSTKS